MSDNKRTFEVDGKEYAINRPNAALSEESNLEYTRVFSKAVKAGALLKDAILNKMREQGLWSDEKEMEYLTEIRNLNELEKKLKKGGIKLSEAKSIAFDMLRKRERLQSLISQKNKLDNNSAEGQAETARFNFLLVNCLVYNNGGERVYRDVDDFLGKQSTDVAIKASETLANMWYGLSEDYEKTLPENKFLKKFEFVDDDLRLINEKGELVNEVGKSHPYFFASHNVRQDFSSCDAWFLCGSCPNLLRQLSLFFTDELGALFLDNSLKLLFGDFHFCSPVIRDMDWAESRISNVSSLILFYSGRRPLC